MTTMNISATTYLPKLCLEHRQKFTKVALEKLFPLVCKGGIIAFDEFNYDKFPGETEAVKEYFNINEIKLERFYFDPFIGYMKV